METHKMKQQSNAWYTQFWPWFLIFLPGSVVIASIATIIIASQNPDGVIVDDYYKAGLAINRDLSREQQARILNIKSTLQLDSRQGIVKVHVTSTSPVQAESLQLHLLHPTLAHKDQVIALSHNNAANYIGNIQALSNGEWNVILSSHTPSWRIQKRINITGMLQHTTLR